MANIVDAAIGAGSFKTLVAAVSAAGLVETLKGAGPFTVLAPSACALSNHFPSIGDASAAIGGAVLPPNPGRVTASMRYFEALRVMNAS